MSLVHSPQPTQMSSQAQNQQQAQAPGQPLLGASALPVSQSIPPLQLETATAGVSNSPISQRSNLPEHFCTLCNEVMNDKIECLLIVRCNHAFHRACIENFLLSESECPICRVSCDLSDLQKLSFSKRPLKGKGRPRGAMAKQYHTRSFSKNLFQEQPHQLFDISHTEQQGGQTTFVANTPNGRTQDTSNNLSYHTVDYNEINKMIENNLNKILTNLNLIPNNSDRIPTQQNAPPLLSRQYSNMSQNRQTHSNSNQPPYNHSLFSSNSSNFNTDKVTSIIQNWGLKFDGSPNTIHIEEFLYRLSTLTKDNFNGDFSLVCKNLHILLSGKAGAWLWRYRKQVDVIEWDDFCDAIRFQYKDYKSTFDIREEIRNRKQRPGESFDSFYEAVSGIVDRLPSPFSDRELIEILTRNLRPDIRHELLYVPVNSIPHLRKLVQMRESFLNDEYVKRNFSIRNTPTNLPRRQIAELGVISDSSECLDSSVDAIHKSEKAVRCWNCDQLGHYWEDCLDERSIFCYGCGEKNVYKPQCQKCHARRTKNFKHPTSPNDP